MDIARTYHPLAVEYSGLVIPPEEFGGRASVGQEFEVKDKPWLKGAYTEDHHLRVQCAVFETPAFATYAKAADGAVSFIQTRKNQGEDIVTVAGLRNTDEGMVNRFWGGNNIRQDMRPEFVRKVGLDRIEIYQLCDVVIDRDVEHLEPLIGSGKTLIRLLPGGKDYGVHADYPATPKGIIEARGWRAVAGHLAVEPLAA